MSEPTYSCGLCGRSMVVKPDGRGFPPDITKRKLVKACRANGCACEPVYRAGLTIGPRARGMG
jgi:hypothetical protein